MYTCNNKIFIKNPNFPGFSNVIKNEFFFYQNPNFPGFSLTIIFLSKSKFSRFFIDNKFFYQKSDFSRFLIMNKFHNRNFDQKSKFLANFSSLLNDFLAKNKTYKRFLSVFYTIIFKYFFRKLSIVFESSTRGAK